MKNKELCRHFEISRIDRDIIKKEIQIYSERNNNGEKNSSHLWSESIGWVMGFHSQNTAHNHRLKIPSFTFYYFRSSTTEGTYLKCVCTLYTPLRISGTRIKVTERTYKCSTPINYPKKADWRTPIPQLCSI